MVAESEELRFEVPVYPGLFYLVKGRFEADAHPGTLVGRMLSSRLICIFGTGGIAFNSLFESLTAQVIVKFTAAASVDTLDHNSTSGSLTLGSDGFHFENPDQVVGGSEVVPPTQGTYHVSVERYALADETSYVPIPENINPTGLERWTLTFTLLDPAAASGSNA
ncbi:hypothetical protein [Amycolatopsis sp. NPDC051372]|uniref:hypothetical protein n=1 Tax=Amycolatopsis sp. NPDC051372 TaxID=3155669 RepID=UPI00343AAC25